MALQQQPLYVCQYQSDAIWYYSSNHRMYVNMQSDAVWHYIIISLYVCQYAI